MKERHVRHDKSFIWNVLFVYPDCNSWRTVNDSDELDYLSLIVNTRSSLIVGILPIVFAIAAGIFLW